MLQRGWICTVVATAFACLVAPVGAQSVAAEDKAKAAFAQIVQRCSEAYGQSPPQRVVEMPRGGFMRSGGAVVKLSHDITRTQSLVSPLLGVVTAELTAFATRTMATKEEAEVAPVEPMVMTREQFSFALQDDVWVYKSTILEAFSVKDGAIGKRDIVLTSDPKPGPGPVPSRAYVCAYGKK